MLRMFIGGHDRSTLGEPFVRFPPTPKKEILSIKILETYEKKLYTYSNISILFRYYVTSKLKTRKREPQEVV